MLALPDTAKSSIYACVAKRDNGWMIEGDPYVCNSTPTEMDIAFWGNGATASGTVYLQIHIVGERA